MRSTRTSSTGRCRDDGDREHLRRSTIAARYCRGESPRSTMPADRQVPAPRRAADHAPGTRVAFLALLMFCLINLLFNDVYGAQRAGSTVHGSLYVVAFAIYAVEGLAQAPGDRHGDGERRIPPSSRSRDSARPADGAGAVASLTSGRRFGPSGAAASGIGSRRERDPGGHRGGGEAPPRARRRAGGAAAGPRRGGDFPASAGRAPSRAGAHYGDVDFVTAKGSSAPCRVCSVGPATSRTWRSTRCMGPTPAVLRRRERTSGGRLRGRLQDVA